MPLPAATIDIASTLLAYGILAALMLTWLQRLGRSASASSLAAICIAISLAAEGYRSAAATPDLTIPILATIAAMLSLAIFRIVATRNSTAQSPC